MPLGTVGLLGVPISDEDLQVIAVVDRMLPAIGAKGRPHHVDVIRALRRDQEGGIHVATVEQVGSRQQIPGCSVLRDWM